MPVSNEVKERKIVLSFHKCPRKESRKVEFHAYTWVYFFVIIICFILYTSWKNIYLMRLRFIYANIHHIQHSQSFKSLTLYRKVY